MLHLKMISLLCLQGKVTDYSIVTKQRETCKQLKLKIVGKNTNKKEG